MMWIAAVEGASRESLCGSLGIKAGCALSKRASSGPTRLAPATSSPCEAFWIYYLRGTIYYLFGKDAKILGVEIVENGVVFWVCWGRMVGRGFWCFWLTIFN